MVLTPWRVLFGLEQHLLGVDEAGPIEIGQLVLRPKSNRVHWTRLFTEATEDAADHVDLIDLRVAFARRYGMRGIVVRRLDVDGAGRTGRRAQLATDAALEPIFVAVQPVPTAKARRQAAFNLRIGNRDRRLRRVPQGGPEALGQAPRAVKHERLPR